MAKPLFLNQFLAMKQKINLLIGFAALVFVALSAMQYYLVKTAYDYKVAEFRNEIKATIASTTNDFGDIDSALVGEKDALYKELAQDYRQGKRAEAVKIALLNSHYRDNFTRKLEEKFARQMPDLSVDFAVVLDKFVLYDKQNATDTIFAEKPQIANTLYGNLHSLDDAFLVRSYVGTISDAAAGHKILTEDTLYISVRDWEMIVFKRMTLILVFAVLSILVLVTLFFIAIRALIKQKKITDVKTDFINNITHELKTPLTTLSVSTKILQRDGIRENEAVFNNVVETIGRQHTRLHHLIDQVMTGALGFEALELTKEKVSATQFLETIVADFTLAHPDVPIHTVFHADGPITIDKFHVTTAINNVLENAVKYGCTNITIVTSEAQDGVKIAIQDDGVGISKANQPLLFDKFFRVQQGNLHNTKGLGLGLYYVEQIIKAHRGTIAVVSDLGKGATFTINIPAR